MSEPNPYRVNVTTTELRSTTVDYLHYSVIPVLILFVLSVGVMGTRCSAPRTPSAAPPATSGAGRRR